MLSIVLQNDVHTFNSATVIILYIMIIQKEILVNVIFLQDTGLDKMTAIELLK